MYARGGPPPTGSSRVVPPGGVVSVDDPSNDHVTISASAGNVAVGVPVDAAVGDAVPEDDAVTEGEWLPVGVCDGELVTVAPGLIVDDGDGVSDGDDDDDAVGEELPVTVSEGVRVGVPVGGTPLKINESMHTFAGAVAE